MSETQDPAYVAGIQASLGRSAELLASLRPAEPSRVIAAARLAGLADQLGATLTAWATTGDLDAGERGLLELDELAGEAAMIRGRLVGQMRAARTEGIR